MHKKFRELKIAESLPLKKSFKIILGFTLQLNYFSEFTYSQLIWRVSCRMAETFLIDILLYFGDCGLGKGVVIYT